MTSTQGERRVCPPEDDGERRQRVRAICRQLVEIEGDTRFESELVRLCDGDKEMEGQVRSILRASSDDFLVEPIARVADLDRERYVGQRLGPYRIREVLGEGGMGVVYRGEREQEFEQEVAIKILKRGERGSEKFRRFLGERKTLGKLNHPYIGRIFDGGEIGDRPYLAMEYIEGIPLDQYCEVHELSVSRRLDLFLKVCSAVSSAHSRLIVHRDIKPSNILVTIDGSPKLLDFGIAKVLGPDGVDQTEMGENPMTPAYASPEQVSSDEITVGSDVYSLGVVLYQMLTGQLPYSFGDRSYPAIADAICKKMPTRPSSVVAGDNERRFFESGVARLLRGDLDTIVLKALRKEPERRYAGVDQLAEDIRRHLSSMPILARDDSYWYVLRKFVRRNRPAVIAAVIVTLLGVAFFVNTIVQAERVRKERDRAEGERDRAERAVAITVDIFKRGDPREVGGRNMTVREALRDGVDKMRLELSDDPKLRAPLLRSAGEVFASLGEFDKAEEVLVEASALTNDAFGERSVEAFMAMYELGDLYRLRYDYDEALEVFLTIDEGTLPDSVRVDYLCALGNVYVGLGRLEEGGVAIRQGLELRGSDEEIRGNNAECSEHLATYLVLAGQQEEARYIYEKLRDWYDQEKGRGDPGYARNLGELGELLIASQEIATGVAALEESVGSLRDSYGENNIFVARFLRSLGMGYRSLGRGGEAEQLLREIIEDHAGLAGEHAVIGLAKHELAGLIGRQGRLEEALLLEESALDEFRVIVGEKHSYTASAWNGLGRIHMAAGRVAEAEDATREAVQVFEGLNPEGSVALATSLVLLGRINVQLNDPEECFSYGGRGLDVMERVMGEDHLFTGDAALAYGECLLLRNEADAAAVWLDRAGVVARESGRSDLERRIESVRSRYQ